MGTDGSSGSRPRTIVGLVLLGYWGALFIGTHIPLPAQTLSGGSDKWLHWAAYAGLAYLLALWLSFRTSRPRWGYVLALILVAAYAPMDELLQGPVNRSPELADCLADWLGCVTGLTALAVMQPFWDRLEGKRPK